MAIAQELPIDTSADADAMANEIFGNGITVVSASYSGDPLSSGIYSDGDTVSPEATPGDTGVILSTGHATDFTNSSGTTNTNTSASRTTDTSGIDNDSDFNALAGTGTRDASILEATFVPLGDTITLDFVLSSDEYPEYINSIYNDVVGVWVNGVQATVSVGNGDASIGNINGGSATNLYLDNTADQYNTEMDGFTVTLTFVAPVNPGVENTIKIGVADVADTQYDTNLLIAGGSVQSTIVARADDLTIGNNDTTTIDVLANDSSTGGTLTITHINGTPVVAGSSVTLGTGQVITLNPDGTLTVAGDDDAETVYFNYSIEDQVGNTDTGIVEISQVPCFTTGTLIETEQGLRPIETLRPGQRIRTRDDGWQPLRWIGSRTVPARGRDVPIRLGKGTLGANRPLLLSPQHRVLISGAVAELLCGEVEILVKVGDLVDGQGVAPATDLDSVTYVHLLFDRHQIITANGVACESYLPGPCTMQGFDKDTQAELFRLFPELQDHGYGTAARPLAPSWEARPLVHLLAA